MHVVTKRLIHGIILVDLCFFRGNSYLFNHPDTLSFDFLSGLVKFNLQQHRLRTKSGNTAVWLVAVLYNEEFRKR